MWLHGRHLAQSEEWSRLDGLLSLQVMISVYKRDQITSGLCTCSTPPKIPHASTILGPKHWSQSRLSWFAIGLIDRKVFAFQMYSCVLADAKKLRRRTGNHPYSAPVIQLNNRAQQEAELKNHPLISPLPRFCRLLLSPPPIPPAESAVSPIYVNRRGGTVNRLPCLVCHWLCQFRSVRRFQVTRVPPDPNYGAQFDYHKDLR